MFLKFFGKGQHSFDEDLQEEVYGNWELFHVMDQRQFYHKKFVLDVWQKGQEQIPEQKRAQFSDYVAVLSEFNRLFDDVVTFEARYSSSFEMKTKDNAKILHAKKEALDHHFSTIGPVVEKAWSLYKNPS